jgi:hypothetical protein
MRNYFKYVENVENFVEKRRKKKELGIFLGTHIYYGY